MFIVDDNPLFRQGIKRMLNASDRFVCCGEAENGSDALKAMGDLDLLMVDIEMPKMDGPTLIRELRFKNQGLKVIVLSEAAEVSRIKELIDVGIQGHIVKSDESSEIMKALTAVASGERYFSAKVGERFLDLIKTGGSELDRSGRSISSLDVKLSPREMEVAELVSQGLTNKEIASRLNCSDNTIKSHKSNLMRKIGAKNSVEITSWILKGR